MNYILSIFVGNSLKITYRKSKLSGYFEYLSGCVHIISRTIDKLITMFVSCRNNYHPRYFNYLYRVA